ncbi:hypothetical protein [Undibacterium sp. Ren11W]|uniref:hypothetical protein n=1 Tax=Undibacterium sp. Ren11W TaxID=3413045 RepID=UPI003BF0D09C
MTVQLELWHLILLLVAFFGAVGAGGKMLFAQFEKTLAVRFVAQENAALAANKTIHDALNRHLLEEGKALIQMQALERDFLTWRAELPMQYVRREDYIRNQTIIESKLDGLWQKLEIIQLRGNK